MSASLKAKIAEVFDEPGCDKAELSICRAPSCSVCSDYAVCFGPEDAVAA
jgi:NifQ